MDEVTQMHQEDENLSPVKRFYQKNIVMVDTDLWMYLEFLDPKNKESFQTVLYNLVLTLRDIYTKCTYYNFKSLQDPMLYLMHLIVEELGKRVTTGDTEGEAIDKNLLSYNKESREEIKRFYKKIETPETGQEYSTVKDEFGNVTYYQYRMQ